MPVTWGNRRKHSGLENILTGQYSSFMITPPRGNGASSPSPAELVIDAKRLCLRGPQGPVFGPVDLQLKPGAVGAILGPSGSGRTCLLLALSGRIRPSDGSLSVFGQALPKAARRVIARTAVAGMPGVDDLDDALSVKDMIRERVSLLSSLRHRVPAWGSPAEDELAVAVFGDQLPSLRSRVGSLAPRTYRELQILLAMMAGPELLLVDELDRFGDSGDESELWQRLGSLAATGLSVVAASRPGAPIPAGVSVINLERQKVAA